MKGVLALSLAFVRTTLRERETLFWFCIFPLALLALLSALFGQVEKGEVDLFISVVDLDRGPLGQELVRVLETCDSLLRLRGLPPQATEVEQARKAVEKGDIHAALVIPADFSQRLVSGGTGGPARVQILYRRGEASSSMAAESLAVIAEEFSHAFLRKIGRVGAPLSMEVQMVGGEARTIRYAEFIFPGVILMAFLVLGLFGVPEAVVLAKETGVLRRYFATPLSAGQYLSGVAIGMVFVSAVQVAAIWALGWCAFHVRLPLLRPLSLAFVFLALATSLGLGLFISAVSRDYARALALANLLNLPLQFAGGLYFPLASLPEALRVLMAVNPLTHLAEGWRASLGLSTSAFPLWLNVLVPLLWLSGSILLASKRVTLVEGR